MLRSCILIAPLILTRLRPVLVLRGLSVPFLDPAEGLDRVVQGMNAAHKIDRILSPFVSLGLHSFSKPVIRATQASVCFEILSCGESNP